MKYVQCIECGGNLKRSSDAIDHERFCSADCEEIHDAIMAMELRYAAIGLAI